MVLTAPLVPEMTLVYLFQESGNHDRVEQAPPTVEQAITASGPVQEITEHLTPRELEVLKLTASGMLPKEIAGELHVS